jgi:PBP1b-binding outer membrane lipoprotein LpoB
MTGYTKPITPIAIFHVLIIALLLFSGCSGTPAPEKITDLLLDDAQKLLQSYQRKPSSVKVIPDSFLSLKPVYVYMDDDGIYIATRKI